MDVERYGPWALVVGGSEGVGAAFARKLAASGFKLVLVARKPGPLEEVAQDLRGKGAEVRTLSVDMGKADAIDRVRTVTDDVEVGLLVYNAGANAMRGNFVELDPAVYRTVIGVNVIGQSEFARHYGGLMRQRERGGIILTGSLSGYIGSASLAAYCGAKAFSRVFSEALWAECEQFGVDVLHLNLGLTATPAMERLGYDLSAASTPDQVAQEGLDNVANGPVWIAGGQANIDRAQASASAQPRAAAVRAVAAPPRK
ncbi:SDR family NAD(P)-dependent oxidoreductase [Phenylobacterium sp.]|jgi:short-subunit dehydrogenase|uniref:SDR family NAD(P)-dependent oxidoreductase n=1 Tax=Phenylobacterium sp. TaxID=1871053 RepID=UPI002F422186